MNTNSKRGRAKVSMSREGFKKLTVRFPQQAEMLENLVHFVGSRVIIDLKDLTPHVKEKLGVRLIDKLYQLAYRLDESKFLSYYIQLNEILKLPKSKAYDILEIGTGVGIFESLINNYDYKLVTLDIDLNKSPDIQGDILNIPIREKSADLVCAFEVLEHLPYRYFQVAIKEMARCAKHYLYVSLPCQTNSFYFHLNVRFIQRFFHRFSFKVNIFRVLPIRSPDKDEKSLLKRKDRHNPHYWEVGRKSYPKKKILNDIQSCGLNIVSIAHNKAHPYHWFILCKKK